jgi:hypothetical protein
MACLLTFSSSPIPHLQTKGEVVMCLIQYINTANLGSFTSENFAVKLGKHTHMGRNTVIRLEYYHASQAYQYKYALADWCFCGLGEA